MKSELGKTVNPLNFDIISYYGAAPILFGMSEHEVASVAGDPMTRSKNRKSEKNYLYDGWSLRYSVGEERVVEVGFTPRATVSFSNFDIFRTPDAFYRLIEHDGNPVEVLGFIVLLKLGITLTGFHDGDESQKAVTAFARGRWDNFEDRFKPYSAPG